MTSSGNMGQNIGDTVLSLGASEAELGGVVVGGETSQDSGEVLFQGSPSVDLIMYSTVRSVLLCSDFSTA